MTTPKYKAGWEMPSLAGQPLSISTSPMEGEGGQSPISDITSFSTPERILGGLLGIIHPAHLSQQLLCQSC